MGKFKEFWREVWRASQSPEARMLDELNDRFEETVAAVVDLSTLLDIEKANHLATSDALRHLRSEVERLSGIIKQDTKGSPCRWGLEFYADALDSAIRETAAAAEMAPQPLPK